MVLRRIVKEAVVVARGVIGVARFDGSVHCQTCGDDAGRGSVVVSETGRAYCSDDACCGRAAVTGDEVNDPRVGGRVYSGRNVGYAVGSGQLVHFSEPSMIVRSGR